MLEGAFGFINACALFLPLRTNAYTFREIGASNLLCLLEHGVPIPFDLVHGVVVLDQLVEVLITPFLLTLVDCFLIVQDISFYWWAILNLDSEDVLQQQIFREKG